MKKIGVLEQKLWEEELEERRRLSGTVVKYQEESTLNHAMNEVEDELEWLRR